MCVCGCACAVLLIFRKVFIIFLGVDFVFYFFKYNYFFKNDIYTKEHMTCAQLSKFLRNGNSHLIIAKLRKLNVPSTYEVPLYPLPVATTLLYIPMILTFKTIDNFWLFGTIYNLNHRVVTLLCSFVQCYMRFIRVTAHRIVCLFPLVCSIHLYNYNTIYLLYFWWTFRLIIVLGT